MFIRPILLLTSRSILALEVGSMTLRNQSSQLLKVSLQISIVVVGMFGDVPAAPQEMKSTTPQSQDQSKQTDQGHCRNSLNCIDVGPYTATVTDIIASETPNSRLVRLILRFENLTDHTLILGYRAHSGFLLDNFKSRYFCCRGAETALDPSAVGIGTDLGDKIDPQFMLKPKESDSASFDLWRQRPPNQPASYYDFDLMIDQIDPADIKTVLKHPYLSFRNLKARVPNRQ
jgi:hypothetical protein